jgi:hypothetical protein
MMFKVFAILAVNIQMLGSDGMPTRLMDREAIEWTTLSYQELSMVASKSAITVSYSYGGESPQYVYQLPEGFQKCHPVCGRQLP